MQLFVAPVSHKAIVSEYEGVGVGGFIGSNALHNLRGVIIHLTNPSCLTVNACIFRTGPKVIHLNLK